MKIGYHASHEQFSPGMLLKLVQQAELAGFDAVMSSDHLAPWSLRQGQAGNAWAWLGAAMQATNLPFGSLAIPGGSRYHPVILAQLIATLAEMFPGRLPWIAAGSGEAMNEHMSGEAWPSKQDRNARLKSGVDMMRALWAGETVNRTDGSIKAHNAKLWTLPETPPKIYGTALSPETAAWAGSWADGLITVRKSPDKLNAITDAFKKGGGENKPMVLQMHVSWAETEDEARQNAWHQWRSNVLGPDQCANLQTPEEFDSHSGHIMPEQMDEHVLISTDQEQYANWINDYAALGFDSVYLHNVGRNQREFINMLGENVLKTQP